MTMTTIASAGSGPLSGTSDAARHGQSSGGAAARERQAFDAAMERQAQAAAPTGTRHADVDLATAAGPGVPGPDAAGERVAGRGAAAGDLAERSAERGAEMSAATSHGSAQHPVANRDASGHGSPFPERKPGPASMPPDATLAALRRRSLRDEAQVPVARWPEHPAPLAAAMPPTELAAAVNPLAAAPCSLAAEVPLATAARRATLAEMAASPTAAPQRWQVQLTEPALPVRSVAIERAAAGPLTLVVSTTQAVPAHQADRLRRQLAARGAEPLLRSAADFLDEDFSR